MVRQAALSWSRVNNSLSKQSGASKSSGVMLFIGCIIPNDPLYIFKLQQCLFNNRVTIGPTETHPSPAVTIDIEKNVRSTVLHFQINDSRRSSLSWHFFSGCFGAGANDVCRIRHNHCFLYERQRGSSLEILFPSD